MAGSDAVQERATHANARADSCAARINRAGPESSCQRVKRERIINRSLAVGEATDSVHKRARIVRAIRAIREGTGLGIDPTN